MGRRRTERGASALELALLSPVLLILIFLTMQAALYFYGRNVAIQSAREGVAQIRLASDLATYRQSRPDVSRAVSAFAANVGSGGLNHVDVTFGAEPDYDRPFPRATVTVTGTTITLVPGLLLHVRGSASGSVERFEADTP